MSLFVSVDTALRDLVPESMDATPRTFSFSADKLGIWASALCLVHCVVTPILLSVSVVFAQVLPGEGKTHRFMAIGVAALGGVALINGFRTHGRRRIVVLMAMGLALIFFGAFYGERLSSPRYEVLITLAGSVLMIAAHRMNHTFCKNCSRCTRHAAD
ncbi:MAG: MerC mercury resistance protein [Edaphobacter sp.]|nr:MerC mercury resistance protein [Edaphobacter sp.]